MNLPPILTSDFSYPLPEDLIALYPVAQRDQARLLYYNKGSIDHKNFTELPDILPDNSTLFFNDTKVIPARFEFHKTTGALIEIFLLEQFNPGHVISMTMESTEQTTWKCMIGNLKKWNDGSILEMQKEGILIMARLVNREKGLVTFSWEPKSLTFAEILRQFGEVPLPPYIKRKVETSDLERYQTIYSQIDGAVAAPTAGLHFTDSILKAIQVKGISTDFLTLHVSAGTFLPVKSENALDHVMHREQIIISRKNLKNLHNPDKKPIAVGTTALRTLESAYWFGARLILDPAAPFNIDSFEPYRNPDSSLPLLADSISAIMSAMDRKGVDELSGYTSIYIFPGYKFKIAKGLITNFHQPGSTLLLLIAALVGPEWKRIYQEAIEKKYRFLSYGDSSLLLPG